MEHLRITVAGQVYDLFVEKCDPQEADQAPAIAAPVRTAAPVAAPPVMTRPAASHAPAAAGDVTSPLAGIVQAIELEVGAKVNAGDLVITLEAMKMYTAINAPASGTLTAIHVNVGDAVDEGQVLYTIT